jgi:putative DNA primase/helicase
VVQLTQAFFQEQDPLGRWIDSLTRCQPREGTAASELLEDFRRWRHEEGETGGPDNMQAFARALQQRGVARLVTSGPKLYGLRVAGSGDFA